MTEKSKAEYVRDRVFNTVAVQFGEDISNIKLETKLVDDLTMDSLDQVEMIIALEDEFGVDLENEFPEEVVTVGDLSDYMAPLVD